MTERRFAGTGPGGITDPAVEVAARLVARGLTRELRHDDPGDRLRWDACALALRFECYLGQHINARHLTRDRIDELVSLLGPDQARYWGKSNFEHRLWAVNEEGTEVGAFSLWAGNPWLYFQEGYGYPEFRRKHFGQRIIRESATIMRHERLGVAARIATDWVIQDAMRAYRAMGLWVYSWKHSIVYICDADGQPARISVGERHASLRTTILDRDVELVRASHQDGVLRVECTDEAEAMDDKRWDVVHCARLSLIVAVAMEGWPLFSMRDQDLSWKRAMNSADGGPDPDALAYKILLAERYAAEQGWRMPEVQIPGIDLFRNRIAREFDEL